MTESYLKILILEDSPEDAGLTLRALKMSELKYEYRLTSSKAEYVKELTEFKPDVILSDHSLPSFTSEEALPLSKKANKHTVFILVTGTVSEEFAVNILKAGADDYLLKSSLTRLPNAIMNAYSKKVAEMEREKNQNKLEEVNKELKTFIYRASHDIRAPLSSMRGLISVAKIEKQPAELNKLIDLMGNSAEKLDNIVVNLIETLAIRDMPINQEKIDLKKIINEIISSYESTIPSEKLKFYTESHIERSFFSDTKILSMILKRIIDNAVKFQNYSVQGAYVTIGIKVDESGAAISVSDNGIGIQDQLINKVFDMFYRANGESGGSGLGLYLAKLGTERLGGKINIKSMQQIGTTVQVSLPHI